MDHKDIAEGDLIERYLMGRLTPEETIEFEEHFVDCQDCIGQLNTTRALIDGLRSAASAGAFEPRGYERNGISWSVGRVSFRKPLALAAGVMLLVALVAAVVVSVQLRRSLNEASQAWIATAEWERRYQDERESSSLAEMKYQESERDLKDQIAQLRTELAEHMRKTEEMVHDRRASRKPQINIATFLLKSTRGSEQVIGAYNEIAVSRSPVNFVISVLLEAEETHETYSMSILGDHARPVWKGSGLKRDRYNSLSVEFNSTFFQQGNYTLTVYAGHGGTSVVGSYSFRVVKSP